MRAPLCLAALTLVAGCEAPLPMVQRDVPASPAEPSPHPDTVFTRYELGSYRYPDEGVSRGESAVYRGTRLPQGSAPAQTGTLTECGRGTLAPLPPSAELSTEIAAQRELTRRLLETHARLGQIERQARGQFGLLLAETNRTASLRAELEAQRGPLRDERPAEDLDAGGERAAAKSKENSEPHSERAVSNGANW